ncbi:MAG TPA: iron-sulfur cluster assembly scaffold protein [Aggregatilineales bacterium]|nr:iron-sulfur cluster assembly scaffold protein [Aggregatilineales bacterium]
MFDMYQENILDHSRHPRHRGLLDEYTHHAGDDNPLCGDRLEITFQVDDDNRIVKIGWDGDGCAISQASASMLGEQILGKPLDEVKALDKDDIMELIGIPLSANRMKCALLSLKVVKAAAYDI